MTWLVRTALLALVGCFAGAADAQTQTYYGLRFPNTVAGFPLMGVQDFEKVVAGLGYAGMYTANGWVIYVFIYDDSRPFRMTSPPTLSSRGSCQTRKSHSGPLLKRPKSSLFR